MVLVCPRSLTTPRRRPLPGSSMTNPIGSTASWGTENVSMRHPAHSKTLPVSTSRHAAGTRSDGRSTSQVWGLA